MSDVPNPNSMLEAMRLTRAARLAEATTLLQRMLRGETAPDIPFATAETIAETGRPRLKRPHPLSRTSARCALRSIVPSTASGSNCEA
jgi:hypothetical protein